MRGSRRGCSGRRPPSGWPSSWPGRGAPSGPLAERNRLARELHDSVGHALTVTTLQAGAAARVLDSDPAFVARALDAIAEAGRAALEDLDHVLGLLRDGAAPEDETARGPHSPTSPTSTRCSPVPGRPG